MRGRQFNHYLWAVDKKTLTEDHIIGTALSVHRKELTEQACGVQVTSWTPSWHWEQWLRDKALAEVFLSGRGVGARAAAAGGRAGRRERGTAAGQGWLGGGLLRHQYGDVR